MISIRFNDEGFVAEFDRVSARLKRPAGLARVLGRAAVVELKAHFRRKNRTPNRLGAPRSHGGRGFWGAVANAVQSPTITDGGTAVRIAISHPHYAQKVYGGTIRAKRGRYISIPLSVEAYGRTPGQPIPGQVPNFEAATGIRLFLWHRGGNKFLAAALAGGIKVHYVLKRSVDQKPDSTAFPAKAALLHALLIRARLYADNLEKLGEP